MATKKTKKTKKSTRVSRIENKYEFRPGVRIPEEVDRDAALATILAYRGRDMSVEEIYDEVQGNSTHPLYRWYNWNAEEAMRLQHIDLTARIMASVRVRVIHESRPEIRTRVFRKVNDEGTGKRVYSHIVDVMKNPEHRAQVLQEALLALKRFQNQYRELSELAQLMDEIHDVLVKYDARTQRRSGKRKSA